MKTAQCNRPARVDVYARVTDRIVADLQAGVRPWTKPWRGGETDARITRPLRFNGVPYRGVNCLLLWMDATDKGFVSPVWMTYRQAQELGGQVRKAETGSLVVYASRVTAEETNEAGESVEREIPFLKGYTVFNAQQIDGLPQRYAPCPTPVPLPVDHPVPLIDAAETFFARTGAVIRHGGHQAFYDPRHDVIQLPAPTAFEDVHAYESTKGHEILHWSGSASRLARTFGKRFGDEAYAFEELVAELGAAFPCADLGLSLEPRDDHAAYLGHWLTVLQGDKRAIFTAAAHAQRALDYLHQLQGDGEKAMPAA